MKSAAHPRFGPSQNTEQPRDLPSSQNSNLLYLPIAKTNPKVVTGITWPQKTRLTKISPFLDPPKKSWDPSESVIFIHQILGPRTTKKKTLSDCVENPKSFDLGRFDRTLFKPWHERVVMFSIPQRALPIAHSGSNMEVCIPLQRRGPFLMAFLPRSFRKKMTIFESRQKGGAASVSGAKKNTKF